MAQNTWIFLGALVCVLFISTYARPSESVGVLKFNAEGSFKIVFFTDLHFGWSEETDGETSEAMAKVLKAERPDFVVLGGDTMSNDAPGEDPKSEEWVKAIWKKVVAPMQGAGVPWSIVIGNHDLGTRLSGSQVAALDASFNGSRTVSSNDVTYTFPVYDWTGKVAYSNLWFFNTHAYGCLSFNDGAGCPTIENVLWYRNQSDYLNQAQRGPIPGLAFMHIPPPEMMSVYNNGSWYGNYLDSDGVCCSVANTGLVANMLDKGDVKVLTFGHDHGNDFFGLYNDQITLAYGRKSGAASYSLPGMYMGARVYHLQIHPDPMFDVPHNARTVYSGYTTLHQPMEIYTWIRVHNGQVLTQTKGVPLLRLGVCCHW